MKLLDPSTPPSVANRRAICLQQAAKVAMAFSHGCLFSIDGFLLANILPDHVEENILAGDLAREFEAQIILAGPIALARYCGIPISSESDEMRHALRLAQQVDEANAAKLVLLWSRLTLTWIACDGVLGWAILTLTERLEQAGILNGAEVFRILEPFSRVWRCEAPCPIDPLQISFDQPQPLTN